MADQNGLLIQSLSPETRAALEHLIVCKDFIVTAIEKAASHMNGRQRTYWLQAADRCAYLKTSDDIVTDPPLLEICLPLTQLMVHSSSGIQTEDKSGENTNQSVTKEQIARCVHEAVNRVPFPVNRKYQFAKHLAYPTLIFVSSIAIMSGMIHFVVPAMISMYDDLGLELPLSTRFLIWQGGLTAGWTWSKVSIAALLVTSPMIGGWWYRNRCQRLSRHASYRHGWISRRAAWGLFARHVGLLLLMGGSRDAAIVIASGSIKKRSIARSVARGLRPRQPGPWITAPTLDLLLGQQAELVAKVLTNQSASQVYSATQQACLLFEISEIYFDSDNAATSWRSILPPAIVCLMGCFVLFVAIVLFHPLFTLITGLT